MATTIRVQLAERSYEIRIDRGNLPRCADFVKQCAPAKRAVVITDDHVQAPHASATHRSLESAGVACESIVVPAGESSKSVAQAERLWGELATKNIDRKTVIVAVGGGVIGDLAGFIAASYARGLRFVQIPTTLLAQVDSSVGGKVGINLPESKNSVGAFWQPAGVLIDLAVLDTLPDREFRSGLAEVVKYGVILDAEFFEYLERNAAEILARQPDALEHIIARSCQLKADVVQQDEREETGLRAVLNYGHTFCHAIETVTGYGRFLHGEAVAIGMVCASRLAEKQGRISGELTERQIALLKEFGLPTSVPHLDADQLLLAMQRDKKAEEGKLRFVLPARLGSVQVVGGIDSAMVRSVLADRF